MDPQPYLLLSASRQPTSTALLAQRQQQPAHQLRRVAAVLMDVETRVPSQQPVQAQQVRLRVRRRRLRAHAERDGAVAAAGAADADLAPLLRVAAGWNRGAGLKAIGRSAQDNSQASSACPQLPNNTGWASHMPWILAHQPGLKLIMPTIAGHRQVIISALTISALIMNTCLIRPKGFASVLMHSQVEHGTCSDEALVDRLGAREPRLQCKCSTVVIHVQYRCGISAVQVQCSAGDERGSYGIMRPSATFSTATHSAHDTKPHIHTHMHHSFPAVVATPSAKR